MRWIGCYAGEAGGGVACNGDACCARGRWCDVPALRQRTCQRRERGVAGKGKERRVVRASSTCGPATVTAAFTGGGCVGRDVGNAVLGESGRDRGGMRTLGC